MDVFTLRKTDFSVGRLVENLTTTIWTERYQPAGEIEFHSNAIEYVQNLLPELSLCTLRDTNEIMIVETHSIGLDSSGNEEIVVKGRSMESFLENRNWTKAEYGKQTKMAMNYKVCEAVEVLIWNAIVNDTGNDVINTSAVADTNDVLPNVVVSDTVPNSETGDSGPRKIGNGQVYAQVLVWLSAGKLGIRNIRPNGTRGRRVDPHADGTYDVTVVDPFNKARMDIYLGRDLTNKVIFSYKADDLVQPQYLFDSTTFRTGVFVDGDPRTHYVTDPDALTGGNKGWNKRDGYLDGGSKDTGTTADDFESSLQDQGLRALRHDWKHVELIQTQISPLSRYKYNQHYRLGDRVTVEGQFGITKTMWVTEFVRTQDESGEVGVPTLSATPS